MEVCVTDADTGDHHVVEVAEADTVATLQAKLLPLMLHAATAPAAALAGRWAVRLALPSAATALDSDALLRDIDFESQRVEARRVRAFPDVTTQTYCMPGWGKILSAATSPCGRTLYAGTGSGMLHAFATSSESESRACSQTPHDGWVLRLAVSPCGETIFSAGDDGLVVVWDAATLTSRAVLDFHSKDVVSASISPCGGRLYTCGGDGDIRITDTATLHCEAVVPIGVRLEAAFESRCGMRVYCLCNEGRLLGVDRETMDIVVDVRFDRLCTALVELADGTLAVASKSPAVPLVGRDGGKEGALEGHTAPVHSLGVSPCGTRVFSGGADGTVRMWDAASRSLLRTFEGFTLKRPDVAAVSPCGSVVFCAAGGVITVRYVG